MVLKLIIVVLFLAVVASLSGGLVFLLKDMQVSNSKRTLYALGIRIGLAATLMAVIGYGIASGKLGNTAPWSQRQAPPADSGP